MVEFIKLIAPITPFLSENLYQNLVKDALPNQMESVHLCELPEYDMSFLDQSGDILAQMETVMDIVNLGQSLRVQNALKVRQPLASLYVQINENAGADKEMKQWMKDLIMNELNVKEIIEVPKILDDAGWIKGENPEKNMVLSLNTNLTDEMKWEGAIREMIRGIQNLRKKQGMQIGDKINISISTEDEFFINAIKNNTEMLKQGINAEEFKYEFGHIKDGVEININKSLIYVKL
jgi:isoleucyl-tRNA synthetase